MKISGLQKLTLLDFPSTIAATVFTSGCNLRCPFCHNAALVTHTERAPEIPQEDFFAFLQSRVGKLDGVCISGGEPLLQADIAAFIRRIRELGFAVKLDTNGYYPDRLRPLIDEKLLDYVAMDVKNAPSKYAKTVGLPLFDIAPVLKSISILKEGAVPYEFRTTLVKGLHQLEDMHELGMLLEGAESYYLQNFVDSGDLVGYSEKFKNHSMDSFSMTELEEIRRTLLQYVPATSLRA